MFAIHNIMKFGAFIVMYNNTLNKNLLHDKIALYSFIIYDNGVSIGHIRVRFTSNIDFFMRITAH